MTREPNGIDCDVLVVGGGLAASMAALAAAESGARVVMAVKGGQGRSGSSAKSAGIIAAAFGHVGVDGEPLRDEPAAHAADTLHVGCGLNSAPHVRVLAEQAPDGVRALQSLGVPFSTDGAGRFVQLLAPGNRTARACSVLGGGRALMEVLGRRLAALGVRVIEDASAVTLHRDDVGVRGARLVLHDGGTPLDVRAGATVLAAGGATGLFPSLSGDRRNTGDALVLGYSAGAALANLEFVEFTLIFRVRGQVLSIAGLAPFMSRGAVMIDRDGAPVLARHHDRAAIASLGRAELLRAVVRETVAGRAPVALDCRHFADTVWDEFERSQGAAVLAPIRAAGGDCRREPVEVVPAAHSLLAGLVVDTGAATGVPGLYAAGECATGIHGAARLSGNGLGACLVFGRIAGRNAAAHAREAGVADTLPAPTREFDTTPRAAAEHAALRETLGRLAENGLGVIRDATSLAAAAASFRDLRRRLRVSTGDPQGLELAHLATLGELMAEAALRRDESRGLHYRTDHPASDARWDRWQLVRRGADGEPAWSAQAQLQPVQP